MIWRVASSRPPGVSNRTSSNSACSFWACAMASLTMSTVMGWITPSIGSAITFSWARINGASKASNANRTAFCKHIQYSWILHVVVRQDYLTQCRLGSGALGHAELNYWEELQDPAPALLKLAQSANR